MVLSSQLKVMGETPDKMVRPAMAPLFIPQALASKTLIKPVSIMGRLSRITIAIEEVSMHPESLVAIT